MKRSGPLKRGKPMARKAMKRKPPPHGFPEEARMFVRRRSGGRCEVQTVACTGEAQHFHHRKLRRHKDHSAVNCLHVCRSCHDRIHAHPEASYLMGWLIHSFDEPADIPLRRGSGG